jgi:hypothetical protein
MRTHGVPRRDYNEQSEITYQVSPEAPQSGSGGILPFTSISGGLLQSVDRSVRLGRLGVCPECQMAEVGKSWTISESVQRSDG